VTAYQRAVRAEVLRRIAKAIAGCIQVVLRMEKSAFRQCRWRKEVAFDGSLKVRVRTSVRVDVQC
jgi:hypothetical protein